MLTFACDYVLLFPTLRLVSWTVALFMPILFIPTYLLWRKWRSHHESVELLMIAKLYATAFVPGALVVMIIESVITVVFLVICFQSYISQFMNSAAGKGPATHSPDPSKPDGEAPDGMEFLNLPVSPALIISLLLLSYVTAGGTEESLKYYLTNSVKKHRPRYASRQPPALALVWGLICFVSLTLPWLCCTLPYSLCVCSYKVVYGYLLYAVASALGFSTMENIGECIGGRIQLPRSQAVG